jgi:hypothetical protein
MRALLAATTLLLLTLVAGAQTTQTPFSPGQATNTFMIGTNVFVTSTNQNLFASNGVFAGTNGVILGQLQNNVAALNDLLSQIVGTASNGVISPRGTFVAGNGQPLSQLFSNLTVLPPSPTGQLVSPNVASGNGQLTSPNSLLTGPNGPLGSSTPRPTLATEGIVIRPSVFGTIVANPGTLTADQLALLESLQSLLLNIQFNAQQLLPVLTNAVVASGGVGSTVVTNAGMGSLTNTFTTPLTNAFGTPLTNTFGTPLTNGFGTPLTNGFGTPLTNGFGTPLTNATTLTNTFGVVSPAAAPVGQTVPTTPFVPAAGGISRSAVTPGPTFGTSPQGSMSGSGTMPQSPPRVASPPRSVTAGTSGGGGGGGSSK